MYCKNCGIPIPDDAAFCSACGTPLTKTTQSQSDYVQAQTPEPAQPNPQNKQLSSKMKAAIAAVIVIILIAAGAIFFLVKQHQDQQAHIPVTFTVSVAAESYDEQGGSGMPITIEGTNLDGDAVNETVLAQPSGVELTLLQGDYYVKTTYGGANADGTYFASKTESVPVKVDKDGAHAEKTSKSTTDAIVLDYEAVDPADVTDEQIKDLQDGLKRTGKTDEQASACANAVTSKREARKAQVEEERRKAEEAARQAEAEKRAQEAINSNPTSASVRQPITLTGKVTRIYRNKAQTGMAWDGLWYCLELPSPIKINGQSQTSLQLAHDMNSSASPDYKERYLSIQPWEGKVGSYVKVTGTLFEGPGNAHQITAYMIDKASIVESF